MLSELKKKKTNQQRRARRLRARVQGTETKPRLCVAKSNKHIHVQLIDDEKGVTLASISTLSKDFKKTAYNKKNKESAKQLGLKIAELAEAKDIKRAIFDRGPFKYHGDIAAVADGAREKGLKV